MSRIEISDATIYNHASNPSSYRRGISYFNQGRVFDFFYDEQSKAIYASVEGNDFFYEVNLTLSGSGDIVSSNCECPAYEAYPGGCKHIVAVLKEAQKNLRSISAANPIYRNSTTINKIFDYFNSFYDNQEKKPVEIELTLHVEKESGSLNNSLELRIGSERLYILRDIKKFLIDMEQGIPFEFGKNFTFDPALHCFSETDRLFIDMLYEIIESENMKISKYNSFVEPLSLFKGKKLFLTDYHLRRLFALPGFKLGNAVVFGSPYYHIDVVEENLPIDMVLKQEKDSILLGYSKPKKIISLTAKSDYLFCEGTIYHPSPAQSRNFAPFHLAFSNSGRDNIAIPHSEVGRFVSEVLPFLQKAVNISIDSSLEENFLKEELNTCIFFDRYEEGISARIEFHYGEEIIIPFSPDKPAASDSRIIVRNPEEEKRILDFFERYDFRVEKEKAYLLSEEQVFGFLHNALPQLREICDIFYSESFKRLKTTSQLSFNGGVKLIDNSLLEFNFSFEGVAPEELPSIFESLREKKKYYRLKDGSFLPLDREILIRTAELIERLDINAFDSENNTVHLPKYRAIYLDTLLREGNLNNIERSLDFKQMVQSIWEPQDMDFEIPHQLKKILRDYQKTGYKWLKTLSFYGLGGILADDMGLGKTLQVIAFVLSEKSEASVPALVIAPTSLVYNWQDEVKKFVPDMKVSVISGVHHERLEQLKEINSSDIVVTSYALIRRDIDLYSEVEFSYCFLDEAQHIKNPNTINAKSVKQLNAKGYFALTGTPVENALTELWSIFDFIMPGYLLSHSEFVKNFETPIAKYADEKALGDLSRQIKPFILRRMKKDVLKELPEKIESRMSADMTDEQKKVYMAYLSQARSEIAVELKNNTIERSHIKILSLLTRLRQICCHPSLFLDNYEGESGKVSLLMEILGDAIGGGHRILIFSQFTSMLKIISGELDRQDISYFYLDGSTKPATRVDMVKSFNSGVNSVFLISLKAGGTGLNLTGADMVIHFDPWWNPSVEDQASDRAYRIGQNNVVQVFKLITQGTIEEKIYELQQRKRAMIDAVIQPGETLLSKMTEEELLGLFGL